MSRKKKTYEDRVSAADIRAVGALAAFEYAAEELEAAADAAGQVVLEAEAEVFRLREVRDSAYAQQAAHAARADKIRELVR